MTGRWEKADSNKEGEIEGAGEGGGGGDEGGDAIVSNRNRHRHSLRELFLLVEKEID